MDSRRPQHQQYGPPPTTPVHDPRAQHHHHQQNHQQPPHPPPPPPPPPPQQYSHPPAGAHYQQQPQHQHPPPPPPPPNQYQQPNSHQPYQQPPPAQGGLPPHSQAPYPPHSYSGASHLPAPQGQTLPPIQSTAHAPSTSSSEQPNLPPFRHPSAPPQHEQREVAPEYHQHPQYTHNRSGHATPAPVNRSYSHDSGHQRSPATPAGPGPGQFPPSSGQDGGPPPPGHAPPPHQPMEHGGHHGYPPVNGLPHGPPPPQHPHESHPQHMAPMVDHHGYQHYPPPGQPMYPGPPTYGPATGNIYGTKRKQMRATQACEQCRQRKQKCDEGNPCSFCKENNLTCNYRDTPPAKTDKNMEKLLSYMEQHSAGLSEITQKIDHFERRLRAVEENSQRSSTTMDHTNHTMAGAEVESSETGPTVTLPQPARKAELEDHRTAPHKLLLLWPSVRPLLDLAGVTQKDGYVVEAEDRGILRIWSRGEGIDENDGTQAGGPASPARSDESGEGAPTPLADGLWGFGFPLPSTPSSTSGREYTGWGGLKPNGEIDLDASTIDQLYDSYIQNIHILHPFLDRRRLKVMFNNFKKQHSTARLRAQPFAVGDTQRSLKRKRSDGTTINIGSDTELRQRPTERSPANGIIYLVLALGKICMHKDPLPGVVKDNKLKANAMVSRDISAMHGADSPIGTSAKPSPSSPEVALNSQPTPPSEAALRMHDSRRESFSVDGSSPGVSSLPRNMDIVPGLAYYAKASEILGDQGDGNDLVHAQMFLLAGLYKGQLARVKESMSWITSAGRAVQSLLDRYKLYNNDYWQTYGDIRQSHSNAQSRIKDTRHSLIVLASWTCLQLESDILAELKLPSSNIQSIENLLILPYRAPDEDRYDELEPGGRVDDTDNILLFYTAQLYIRRRLNQIHNEMYGRDSLGKSLSEVQEMLQGHDRVLEAWRQKLPPQMQWQDSDDAPSDILSARLRAKYWGAKFITNRPFLDFALHILPQVKDGVSVELAARDAYGNHRDKADIHLFKAIERFRQIDEASIWKSVRRCVHAAMQSTTAFDNVPDRLIMTNIHGTAHAQFGNMLVLSAVYTSKWGKSLVPQERYKALLERTIKFLRRLAPISPTCSADCGILEKFNRALFPQATEHPTVYKREGIFPAGDHKSEPVFPTDDGSFSAENNRSFSADS